MLQRIQFLIDLLRVCMRQYIIFMINDRSEFQVLDMAQFFNGHIER